MYNLLISLFIITFSAPIASYPPLIQHHGITIVSESPSGMELQFTFDDITIHDVKINNTAMHAISAASMLSPSLRTGAPSLPSTGRYIALPQNASARVTILAQHTKTYHNIDVAPVPHIPLETDHSPLRYEKDLAIYHRNAYYPDQPVALSDPMKLRGVDVVILGIIPFQYNPITRELIVYTDLRVRVDFIGGNGHFGEDRLRSPYWEPILRGHLLNYHSLPKFDFYQRQPRDGYEYLIIVPDDSVFERWADTVKLWRKLQGIYTEVFTLSEVGGSGAAEIEAFIDSAYNNWSMPPAAVLLLSDYPTSGDVYGITSPVWNGYCVSDNIYADVDADDLPDINVARICAQSETHLDIMINKFLSYERSPCTDPGFYDHPLVASGWQTDRWFQLTAEICRGFWVNELNKNPVRQYCIYVGAPSPGCPWSSAPNTDQLVAYFGSAGLGYIPDTNPYDTVWWNNGSVSGINAAINDGSFVFEFRQFEYQSEDLSGLSNDQYPFALILRAGYGDFAYSQACFMEVFHRMIHGCLGGIAPSGINYSFVSDIYNLGVLDGLWAFFDPYYPVLDLIGYPDLRPGFANVSAKYYLNTWNIPPYNAYKQYTFYLYHMFGDAFTTLYSEMPQTLTVAHAPVMPPGVTYFTVQADDSSIIALTVEGEIIGVAEGTGAPTNIPITPQMPGSVVKVTVTKANYFRYEADVQVVASYSGLIMLGHIVDDSLGGNNDGQVNPGETIDYGVWLGNVWPPDTVYSVYALLSTSDPYVAITIDSSWFGDVPADDSLLSNPFYNFSVAHSCPIGHVIQMTLESHDVYDSTRCFYPSLTVYAPSGVEETRPGTALTTVMHAVYPDPCLHVVYIEYQLAYRDKVELKVFDAAGRQTRMLVNEIQDSGYYSINWGIEDEQGRKVSNGIYFVQLTCEDYRKSIKCIVIR